MKITGIQVYRFTRRYTNRFNSEDRQASMLDVYEEFAVREKRSVAKERDLQSSFLCVTTDEGIEGLFGPLDSNAAMLVALEGLAPIITGRDPMDTRMLWDMMSRFDRHARSGAMMMAISAVDIALWDLKGKILNLPVYKLLGGGRGVLRPYLSMLNFSIEPGKARERAKMAKDMGIKAQKWFFRYGPASGSVGMRKNLDMAFAVRDELGDDYDLMFDCWMGWDLVYAKAMFRELEKVHPVWMEEVLKPHMVDGYRILKQESSVPLAAGEHFYTRMEVNGYLKEGIFDVMQSDPEWCGGITENLRIADLCETYGTMFIPHGHGILPAMHVVASMPPDVCPYVEYLFAIADQKIAFIKQRPLDEANGTMAMSDLPGLGYDIDYDVITKTETLKRFEMLP